MPPETRVESPKRIAWVDTARAIGIFAIVYSHAVFGEGPAARLCYAFHVPLFCFCAGWVFHGEAEPFGAFAQRRARGILWPWLLFCLISIGIYALGARSVMNVLGEVKDSSPIHALTETLRGYCYANSPLWFLPCFFLQQLMLRLLTGLRSRRAWGAAAAALGVALACLYSRVEHPQLPWAVDTALILLPFALMGYGLRRMRPLTLPRGLHLALAALALVCGGAVGLLLNTKVNYWDNEYGQPLLFYLGAGLMLWGLSALLSVLPRHPALLRRVGQDSQGILLMHKFPVLFFQVFVPFTIQPLRDASFPAAALVSAVSIALCCLACRVIRRFAPWALGGSGRKKG